MEHVTFVSKIRSKRGYLGIIKVALKKRKSLQLPFECLPLHKVFEKSIKDFAEFFNPSDHF